MNQVRRTATLVPGVLVPRSLVADAAGFGGLPMADCVAGDLVVMEGRAVGLRPSQAAPERLVLPRLTEVHVHLDKCHSIDRMQGVGGDLHAAIAAQRA
ncbi:amidohydrolase, partial [Cribrihabitans sp. XS_ASV171]